jgi:Flp pilus assembly protein TadD
VCPAWCSETGGRVRRQCQAVFGLLAVLSLAVPTGAVEAPAPSSVVRYRPNLRPPASLEPILRHVTPGSDAFPEEKTAEELSLRLAMFSTLVRKGGAAEAVGNLLAPSFRGSSLVSVEEPVAPKNPGFELFRARFPSREPNLDAARFRTELTSFLAGLSSVHVAELLITEIQARDDTAATTVRYDIVGEGPAGRVQHVGRWRMDWRRGSEGTWHVTGWAALDDTRSRAASPAFTEVTVRAFGSAAGFQRQLRFGLDAWLATLDSVFMLDSMGHHGVSAGDADGDGLDDLYVAQPAGLPSRLFRNNGDGTFEDATEAAGLLTLDDTSQSLFADVDNDGDQDLVLVVRVGPMLLRNEGGRFTPVPEAFRTKGGLKGSPIAMAAADYDRDGFLDLYLCTYSYFMGAGEDKAGSPNPYHDASNGPPDVLFRNDGTGRFLDVTAEAGLDVNNDRFSFAAAWGDYNDDGWPDLLVANDFGRKNLFRNLGRKDGKVRFRDVAKESGVEDHGAGMSAAFLDYDNDGRLDIYTGNMWSAAGLRVTALPGFKPDAPAEVRELYKRHARGNSLFRNKGDGTFEDVSLHARAEMGRWAWSSDALDFDRDGFEDLYVVNGMFTREDPHDLDSFFWRQVTARSPLTRVAGTPYEDAWRAVNRLLASGSQANHQRNVFLRNDGQGGFDDVSGTVGLDLDQDGRAFAVLDYDQDGDPDLAVMAARSAPQLRLFRNDHTERNRALSVRLTGRSWAQPSSGAERNATSRDAVGARVTVETDRLRVTKVVQAGSGFLSQHSKELLFGLGKSERIAKLTVFWPSGETQIFAEVPLDQRIRIEEGSAAVGAEAFTSSPAAAVASPAPSTPPAGPRAPTPVAALALPSATWFYEPYPAPEVSLPDLDGKLRSLSALRGRPVVLLFWATDAPASRAALQQLATHQAELARAGAALLAVALDHPDETAPVRAAVTGLAGLTVTIGTTEVGGTYSLLNRALFVTKEDLRLPTAFLLNARGDIVRAYREPISAADILADLPRMEATPAERLARATPFAGTFYSNPGRRNSLQYGLELVEQGFEAPALVAFERAATGDPNAFTLYSLGTLYMKSGQPAKAKAAFERALEVQPDFAEASNGLGALLAQGGNLPAAIARFRVALEATPEYPDALNNLGYAYLQQGDGVRAHDLIEKALALQPDFPEAFNNLGIYYARQGDPARTEDAFRKAVEKRPGYGEAGNNLALVLMAREDVAGAVSVLERLLQESPDFETTYVTLSRIYLSTGRSREGMQVLERLLQRNPNHPVAQQMVKELRASR